MITMALCRVLFFTLFLLMTLETLTIPCMLSGPTGRAGFLSVLPESATSWMWFLFQLESCGRHCLRQALLPGIIDVFWFPKGIFFFLLTSHFGLSTSLDSCSVLFSGDIPYALSIKSLTSMVWVPICNVCFHILPQVWLSASWLIIVLSASLFAHHILWRWVFSHFPMGWLLLGTLVELASSFVYPHSLIFLYTLARLKILKT